MANRWLRLLRHALVLPGALTRAFPESSLAAIGAAIGDSESRHGGEIRFAVEARLPWSYLWRNLPARSRALMIFSKLRVWDTEANNGVLLYVLLADRGVEIVADRGITRHVAPADWNAVRDLVVENFRRGDFERGACAGIDRIGALLAAHFPAEAGRDNPNELADAPTLL